MGRVGGKGQFCKAAVGSERLVLGLRAHPVSTRAGGMTGFKLPVLVFT